MTPALLSTTEAFLQGCRDLDRTLRREDRCAPTDLEKHVLSTTFWDISDVLAAPPEGGWSADTGRALRIALGPWLWRSQVWYRAAWKPHGYAGDYQMLELMYDLEGNAFDARTQPGVLNALDALLATLHCVQGLWHRRAFYRSLLASEHARRGGRLRVLDVACGGARYTRDFLEGVEADSGDTRGIHLTLVDQDASALAFCEDHALAPWRERVRTLSAPIQRLPRLLQEGGYDVVLSTGLYDYLDAPTARALSAHLGGLLAPGGVLAVSNYTPSDPSRHIRAWITDWHLIMREAHALRRLLPDALDVTAESSPERTLAYALGRKA